MVCGLRSVAASDCFAGTFVPADFGAAAASLRLAADPANRPAFEAVGEAWTEVDAAAASPAMMALRSEAFDDLRRALEGS